MAFDNCIGAGSSALIGPGCEAKRPENDGRDGWDEL